MFPKRALLATFVLLFTVLLFGSELLTTVELRPVEAASQNPHAKPDMQPHPRKTPPGKKTPTPTATPIPTATNTPTVTPTPLTSPTPTFTPTPAPSCTPTWEVIESPNPGAGFNKLHNVAAISDSDVWAVGSVTSGQETHQLIEHWDGTSWSVVPAPDLSVDHELFGVDGVAADDVWAVGYTSQSEPVIEHWDGSQWNSVPAPVTRGLLEDVVAISTNDVWAVGYTFDEGYHTLTLHWNGTTWSEVASPDGAGSSQLFSVSASGPDDVWAVGQYDDATTHDDKTLILHWDGSEWSLVPSPNQNSSLNHLRGVTAVAGNDAWAVGYYSDANARKRTMTLHWDGSAWDIVSSPNANTLDNVLNGVTANAGDDVWAVGYYQDGRLQPSLVLHWNGTDWEQVASPGDDRLTAVSAVTGTDVWAVGGLGFTLTEHWDGTAWSVVPSPNTGTGSNRFSGVSAVAAADVWAVGGSSSTDPFTAHWDGSSWGVVEAPVVGSAGHALFDVAAVASNDVWAVGEFSNHNEFPQTFSMHWDGTAWNHIPSPNPGDLGQHVYGVAPLSANDVWAVGTSGASNEYNKSLIMHWDGTAWSIVPSPNAQYNNTLQDIFALAPDDIWAVGFHGRQPDFFTLTMHWDGTSWSIVPSPNNGIENVFNSVSGVNANDVWAVGYWTDEFGTAHLLTARWDGTSWTLVHASDPTVFDNSFSDVVAFAGNDVWAVGNAASETLTMHWDGTRWNHIDSPNVNNNGRLAGVTAVSSDEMWAVGSYFDPNFVEQTLAEHYTCQ